MRKLYFTLNLTIAFIIGNTVFAQQGNLGRCCIYIPNSPTDCTDSLELSACIQRFISSGARATDVLWSRDSTCLTSCPPLNPPRRSLPLQSFNAVYLNETKSVQLSWKIASEEKNSGFFIERSRDGQKFKKLEFLEAKPNSSTPGFYTFTDVNPYLLGYYRLVQLLDNGTMARSHIIKTFGMESGKLLLFPNPSTDRVRIAINNMQLYNTEVFIYDFSGRLVLTTKLKGGGDELSVVGLTQGIYSIRALQNGKTYSGKFMRY